MLTIRNNKIKFNNSTKWIDEHEVVVIDSSIKDIDFNQVLVFKGTLNLTDSTLKVVDLKKIRWIGKIINPLKIRIEGENVVWSSYEGGLFPGLEWYRGDAPLIYLGGKIDEYVEYRVAQETYLQKRGLRVYNPVTVITFPDECVETFHQIPGQLDLMIIDKADYLYYDLNQVSEGTRAEFGYSIGRGYHKSKRIYLSVPEGNTNCLTLALQEKCIEVKDLQEMCDLIEYAEILKKVREVSFSWWKTNKNYTKLNLEYQVDWKPKVVKYTNIKNIDKLIDKIEVKYSEEFDFYNLLLAINCEILEYLESKNEDELSDIFIFASLLYKNLQYQQNFSIDFSTVRTSMIVISPITHSNVFEKLEWLLKWSSSVGEKAILSKQAFNNQRRDHKKSEVF